MRKTCVTGPYFSTMEEALAQLFTPSTTIKHKHSLGGGDIATTYILSLYDEKNKSSHTKKIVSKEYQGNQAISICQAEADGLIAIDTTQSIATAKVYGIIKKNSNKSTLLLGYKKPHAISINFWENFAQKLAEMHKCSHIINTKTDSSIKTFGFYRDNYIGRTLQKNTPHYSWVNFFIHERILYQLHLAIKNKYIDISKAKKIEVLCNKLPLLIPEANFSSLLHGDLWSGNYLCIEQEQAFLIDPAVYYGHYEADIAMTELFGSCDARFYEVYNSILPLEKTYKERKHIYNLYHLLNHLNLFGVSYLNSVMNIVQYFL